jgi:hypothetical protein
MRRLLRLILLLGVFLAGYYAGRQPNSPDIFAWGRGVYDRVDQASRDIAAKARADDTPLPQAAVSYLFDSARRSSAED